MAQLNKKLSAFAQTVLTKAAKRLREDLSRLEEDRVRMAGRLLDLDRSIAGMKARIAALESPFEEILTVTDMSDAQH